jgi:hypothetical protein
MSCDVRRFITERKPMDERQINKFIGYAIVIIIGYHIIGVFIPMLTWGVVVVVVIRIIQIYQNNKH